MRPHRLLLAFAVVLGACDDHSGLALDTDGGAGGVSGSGSGGSPGGAGGAIACPAVCDVFCRYGNAVDARGCPTCKCNPAPTCVAPSCRLYCPNGFKKDAAGCDICECNPQPVPCAKGECGPEPPAECGPGTELACIRSGGLCSWQCPRQCETWRDSLACNHDARCRWLSPGCVEPRLPLAGCYSRQNVDCASNGDCRGGRTCQKRAIDSCQSGSAEPPPAGGSGGGGVAPGPGAPAPPRCACATVITVCL